MKEALVFVAFFIEKRWKTMNAEVKKIIDEIKKAIKGKDDVIEKILMAIFADGHILLDDIPGVGKTTMAVAMGKTLGMKYGRIQFTPDVLPSDIIGFSVYNKVTGNFEYMPGVVNNTNLLLGDEINRTSSKTQSALLEAMEERHVTVDGNTYNLKKPFIVIATQNNVGTAGTQLLPYAQLDRFLIKLSIGYPDFDSQMAIIEERQTSNPLDSINQVMEIEDIINFQKQTAEVKVSKDVVSYITSLTFATRDHELIEVGVSPRGAIAVNNMAKAKAFVDGRDYVTPDDVREIFNLVCSHRVVLSQKARFEKKNAEAVLEDVLSKVKVPNSIKK